MSLPASTNGPEADCEPDRDAETAVGAGAGADTAAHGTAAAVTAAVFARFERAM